MSSELPFGPFWSGPKRFVLGVSGIRTLQGPALYVNSRRSRRRREPFSRLCSQKLQGS